MHNHSHLPTHSHESLCITSSPPTRTPTEPSNHFSTRSRHVNSFSNIRLDLLFSILVTNPTFQLFMLSLKARACKVLYIVVILLTSHVLTRPYVKVAAALSETHKFAAALMLLSVRGVYVFRTRPCLGLGSGQRWVITMVWSFPTKSVASASAPGSAIIINKSIAIGPP